MKELEAAFVEAGTEFPKRKCLNDPFSKFWNIYKGAEVDNRVRLTLVLMNEMVLAHPNHEDSEVVIIENQTIFNHAEELLYDLLGNLDVEQQVKILEDILPYSGISRPVQKVIQRAIDSIQPQQNEAQSAAAKICKAISGKSKEEILPAALAVLQTSTPAIK